MTSLKPLRCDLHVILYKYILVVRVICKKIPVERRGKFHEPQITLTNRIYLFNSAEYLTASKTVACKHHCRLEPRNLSVFFFTIQISSIKFKITADTRLSFFFPLLLVERRNPSNSELHTWRHKLFKEGIFSRV